MCLHEKDASMLICKNVKASFTLPVIKVKVKPIQFQGLIIAINTITSNVITLILMFMHLKSGTNAFIISRNDKCIMRKCKCRC